MLVTELPERCRRKIKSLHLFAELSPRCPVLLLSLVSSPMSSTFGFSSMIGARYVTPAPWSGALQSVASSAWLVFASWAYFGPTVVGSRHTDEDAFLDGDNGVITK